MKSLMYHIDDRLALKHNVENIELIVCGYVRDQVERKLKLYIPEEVVTLIFNYFNAKMCADDFIIKDTVNSGFASKILKVSPKNNETQSFAMIVLKKKKLKTRNHVESTMKEYKILCSIGYHPYINPLHFGWQTKSYLILIRDYYTGGDLFKHLKKQQKFEENITKIWMAQLILAIQHLHSNDIYDIDIKPEYILLDKDGSIHLNKLNTRDHESTNDFIGTPEYLAPELIQDKQVSFEVDWWTLGIIWYELLVGIPPFYHQNLNEMYRRIPEMDPVFPPNLTAKCKDLLSKLLNKDPKDRIGYDDIKVHDYVINLDWNKLEKNEVKVEYDMEEYVCSKWGHDWNDKAQATLMGEDNIEQDADFPQFKSYPDSFVSNMGS